MVNSRLPVYANRRECEEGMALVAGARQTAGVILAHARSIGHREILRETYALLSELDAITTWLSKEGRGIERQKHGDGDETRTNQNFENEERKRT